MVSKQASAGRNMRRRWLISLLAGLLAAPSVLLTSSHAAAPEDAPTVDLRVDPESIVWGSCTDVTCAVPPGPAFYPGNATSKDGKHFTSDPYQLPSGPLVVPRGSNLHFTNTHVFDHSLMSFERRGGKPLFRSEDLGAGDETIVVTSHLRPGIYAYFCTHHADGMFGLIQVTA